MGHQLSRLRASDAGPARPSLSCAEAEGASCSLSPGQRLWGQGRDQMGEKRPVLACLWMP